MRQAMTIRAGPSFPGPERRKQTWQNRKQRFRRRNGLPSGASWRRVQRRQRKKTPPAPQRRRKPRKPRAGKTSGPQTAQQTLPYREMYKDGICRADGRLYTKSMEYEDINCQLAQADDQSAIFDGYCAFLNSFDSSLPVQLSFINHRSRPGSKYRVNIPRKTDSYSGMRDEYVEMLEGQIAKSNNGIVRTKLITFGVTADSPTAAKPRLERAEADIANNFKLPTILKSWESCQGLSPVWNGWRFFTASSTPAARNPFPSHGARFRPPGFPRRILSLRPASISE